MTDKKDNNVKTLYNSGTYSTSQLYMDSKGDLEKAKLGVLVYLDEDNIIHTYWSAGSNLEKIGILEVARSRLVDSMWHPYEE